MLIAKCLFMELIISLIIVLSACNNPADSPDSSENPIASFMVTPSHGSSNIDFQFDASNSTDDNTDLADLMFRWDWESDGQWDTDWSNQFNISHTFNEEGNYSVRMAVKDGGDNQDSTESLLICNDAIVTSIESSISIDHPYEVINYKENKIIVSCQVYEGGGSGWGGALRIFNTSNWNLEQLILTENTPMAMCLENSNDMLYYICAYNDTLYKYSISSQFCLDKINLGDNRDMCISSDYNYLYTACYSNERVSIVDTGSMEIFKELNVSGKPYCIEYDNSRDQVYVLCSLGVGAKTVVTIDAYTHSIVSVTQLDHEIYDIEISDDGHIYGTNMDENSIVEFSSDFESYINEYYLTIEPVIIGIYQDDNTYLYVLESSLNGRLEVLRADLDIVLSKVELGAYPSSVVYNAESATVVVVNSGSDSLSIII